MRKINILIIHIMAFMLFSCVLPEEFETFKVVSYSPSNGKSNLAQDVQVMMEFNNKADKTIIEENFYLSGESESINGKFSWVSSKKFYFTPDDDLKNNVRYTINLPKNVKDLDGNKMEMNFISEFYVGNDLVSPEILSTTPVKTIGGTNNVAVDQNLIIEFSESMDIEETEKAFSISPEVTGYIRWEDNNTRMIFNLTEDMDYGKQYKMTVNEDAADSSGNNIPDTYTVVFTTGNDFEKPAITTIYNSADMSQTFDFYKLTENVSKSINFSVEFSEEMNKNTVESSFSISPSVSGSFQWSGTNNATILTYVPGEDLELETIYTVEFSTTAKDLNSNSLEENYCFSFKTNGDDSLYLKVKGIWGLNSDSNVPGDYNQLYDAASPTASPFTIDMGTNTGDYKDYYILVQFYQSDVSTAVDINLYSVFDKINTDVFSDTNEPSIDEISLIGTTYLKIKLNGLANKVAELDADAGYIPLVYSMVLVGEDSGIVDLNENYLEEDYYFEFSE